MTSLGTTLRATEIKAFVPARDFALSQRFYADLGFEKRSEGGGVAYFQVDGCAFLLQDFHVPALADNLVMHLLVPSVDAWYAHVQTQDLAGRYGVRVTPLVAQPWGITEFVVIDPAGVCWHIGQNTPGFVPQGRLPGAAEEADLP
ncbi:glyoxalase [Hydrogenophaga electricum]|uniref:Glyoxalase n=1 Tax=Hydrogenophaga electricum TaxID=1230953 RepID=A0ABQ6C7U0_9BURK|nr:glyoxalase [Hydrogenophaga electricum]GLS16397.1 glyoxalase [Hydrogenophaga electricum]